MLGRSARVRSSVPGILSCHFMPRSQFSKAGGVEVVYYEPQCERYLTTSKGLAINESSIHAAYDI